MKFNTPLPQPLQKECLKAAQIFKSFVDSGNNGLDGVIPRHVLENAKGFAIFTIFKAGFLFSARAGSGVVIAKLEDGTWSAPSAIGSAGLGLGTQAGAEMTDFLVVLNSKSKSFMSAGSVTLGGNLSVAVGPLGRTGEALGSLRLFGGMSVEGSVIVERQDANAQAYHSDVTVKQLLSGAITPPEWASPLIKTLDLCTGMPGGRRWLEESRPHRGGDYVFGGVESPSLENGPGSRNGSGYFPSDGQASPGKLSKKKTAKSNSISFPPVNWGQRKSSGSYFSDYHDPNRAPVPGDALMENGSSSSLANRSPETRFSDDRPSPRLGRTASTDTGYFETTFQSDFVSEDQLRQHPPLGRRGPPSPLLLKDGQKANSEDLWEPGSPFNNLPPFNQARSKMSDATSHRRAYSAYAPPSTGMTVGQVASNPFNSASAGNRRTSSAFGDEDEDLLGLGIDYSRDRNPSGGSAIAPSLSRGRTTSGSSASMSGKPKLAPKAELTRPLLPHEGVARAIALFDFAAVQSGDLSFHKGQVITVTEKSADTNTWWRGKVDGREGIFPANFVEVV
ncbi:DUF500-domain-containing protein [Epithele typhae]|uniref:DUF500-domain-containing protein n=1 Tax=Epithele typhae TaxID=378194 RepID=UPI0020072E9E|nr:DUF500-domain-containing protein [Epithele typhae]KAH9941124.1 DUF500-domain-containing protein [Epithele typhae]